MKIFDCSDLERGMIFHIGDHDRGFVFVGRVRFYGSDFIQFDVLPMNEAPDCKTLGKYTFKIGSNFTLHGMKWDDKRNGYVYDESIITSEDLEKDDDNIEEDNHMKFDVKKEKDLLEGEWRVQDHDNKFQFNGIFKSIEPDELTFYIAGPLAESVCRGTYTFPAGSKFNLYKLRLDKDKKEWIYSPGPGHIIDWKDITETDEVDVDVKGDKEMKLDSWKDCVIKDNAWFVNDQIKVGDTIYRIKTDAIDIKGHMTIGSTSFGMLSVEFDYGDKDTDSIQIKIGPDMKVFKSGSPKQNERPRIKSNLCAGSACSEKDPGILVQHRERKFNPELRVGRLYHVADSNTGIQYMLHVKSITDNAIEVHIINTVKEINNTSSLTVTGKSFDITELLEYKFKEV